jgi:SOS response regulatory protein OraA/RecX
MTEAVAAWRRKAVDLLARREYSRAELARKLAGREADIDHAATASVMGCALQKTQPGWQMPARLEMPV